MSRALLHRLCRWRPHGDGLPLLYAAAPPGAAATQLRNLKFRYSEEIDALIAALHTEIEARDQALAGMVNGNA